MSFEVVMPSNHRFLCHPLLLLRSIFPSIRVFSNESVLPIRWPKCWSFSFNISPSNEHPGLTSCRMDWLDLLAVQGTLKSLLQHHSWKISIFRAQLSLRFISHIMTTGKTIALMTKVRTVKAMVFLVVMYGYESWTIKKTEHWRIDAFEMWCWRRLKSLQVCKEFKAVSPKYSLEGLMLKLKL